ncbi:hypothetical protein BJY04DRAFT_192387 [Aspergillus karnatakaensis]|uniref:uncharacterized protein n=1 Tax=Aspergillus karnatakaensis TaxID=1810916 RepID=UPI003CCC954D
MGQKQPENCGDTVDIIETVSRPGLNPTEKEVEVQMNTCAINSFPSKTDAVPRHVFDPTGEEIKVQMNTYAITNFASPQITDSGIWDKVTTAAPSPPARPLLVSSHRDQHHNQPA